MTSELPFAHPEDLKTLLGSLRYDAIVNAKVFLVHHTTRDQTARSRQLFADSAYQALMIAAAFLSHDEGFMLTGKIERGEPRLFSVRDVPGTSHSNAKPPGKVELSELSEVPTLTQAIEVCRYFDRLGRMLRTYTFATRENDLETRLHQFVRIIEGLLYSRNRSEFATRSQELVIGEESEELKILYAIRSCIEHLKSGLFELTGDRSEQLWRLEWHCVRAEALARHVLRTCLLNDSLWPYLNESLAVQELWSLSLTERATLFGPPLALKHITEHWDTTRPPPPPTAEEMARFANPEFSLGDT